MSTASKPMAYDGLSSLLSEARLQNQRRGITGMLLYQQDTFMQMLEGEEDNVRSLYAKLLQDKRHKALHIVHEGHTDRRVFDDWSMGFVNMDKAGEYPEYQQYIDSQLVLDVFKDGSQDVYQFLKGFSQLSRK
jgi:hypothetical protein